MDNCFKCSGDDIVTMEDLLISKFLIQLCWSYFADISKLMGIGDRWINEK
jgi:hypothetical protein